MKPATPVQPKLTRRSSSTMAALLLGIPLGLAVLVLLNSSLFAKCEFQRYLKHPVQHAIVIFFFSALGTLGVKLLAARRERHIFSVLPIPPWNGKVGPISEAQPLLSRLRTLSSRMQSTYLFRRVEAILDFLCHRGSATELDDQVRTLSDNDAMNMEGSYGLTRFITWAMPILGFLGTVLGITAAISGVSTDQLETGLSKVTGGLGEAFDSTARPQLDHAGHVPDLPGREKRASRARRG